MMILRSNLSQLTRRRRRSSKREWFAYFGSFGDDFFSDTDAD